MHEIQLDKISKVFLRFDGKGYVSNFRLMDELKSLKYLWWFLNSGKRNNFLKEKEIIFISFTKTQLNIILKIVKNLTKDQYYILPLSNSISELNGMLNLLKLNKTTMEPFSLINKKDIVSIFRSYIVEKKSNKYRKKYIKAVYYFGRRRIIFLKIVKKIIESIFRNIKPKVVVLPEDRSDSAMLISEEVKNHGLNVVTFQHGFYSDSRLREEYRISPASSDLYLVFGKKFKEVMVDSGVKKNKIKITGNPLYDKFYKILKEVEKYDKEKKDVKVLLFASQPLPERKRVLKLLRNVIKNKKDFILVDKLHPAEQFITHRIFHQIAFFGVKNVKIIPKGYIEHHIANCDIFTTISSTSFLGAVVLNKPVIFLGKSPINLEKYRVGIEVNSTNEFIKALANIDVLRESIKKHKEFLIRDYLYRVDGKSAKRMAREISKLSRK